MLKALARLKFAFFFALLFGVQTTTLSFHETAHAALSADQKYSHSISTVSDDCSLCAAQHTQADSTFVQLEPSEAIPFPPTLIRCVTEHPVSTVSAFSQPRAPPVA